MKRMKPKTMWAIVDCKTGELGTNEAPYKSAVPLLYEREEWAKAEVGKGGRVVKVEIRQVKS